MIKDKVKKFWKFLQEDTWQSWIVSLVLIVILIKFIFFPTISFITGSPLPLVVIESCSMYHNSNFESWWDTHSAIYSQYSINKSEFQNYPFKNGLNKGDVIFVWGRADLKEGDVIIFEAGTQHPLIHRLISTFPLSTKGDNNENQLDMEKFISQEKIIGKGIARIPLVGWLKLIFFDMFKPASQRGFCN
ncbi:MAG: S26 family signal peptidase [archaeon]|nr:S26 family signal peptidase [archaeon]